MWSYIFNGTNLLILIIFGFFSFGFWMPYFKGKKYEAVVDGYAHPEKGEKRELEWVIKFMYREENGRRNYCYSKRVFDTHAEAIEQYPKGAKVDIRVYKETKNDINEQAIIMTDNTDLKRTLFYTFAAIVCCIALGVGFKMFDTYFGS